MKSLHARRIAFAAGNNEHIVESVAECIGLVSCSKNKNSVIAGEDSWKLFPRHCDRLEAIGWPGGWFCFFCRSFIEKCCSFVLPHFSST